MERGYNDKHAAKSGCRGGITWYVGGRGANLAYRRREAYLLRKAALGWQ